MKINTHYIGEAGKEYDKIFEGQEPGWDIQAQYFKKYIKPEDIVLDFGCGRGEILKNIKCLKRIGIEINDYSRKIAKNKLTEVYERLENVPDNSFNIIISNHALEHVPDPYTYLVELKKKLKDDGKIIFVLPLDDWRSKEQRKYKPNDIHQHLFAWTPQSIYNLFKIAGYRNIKVDIIRKAWSPKIFFAKNTKIVFDFLQTLLAIVKRRRQLLIIAQM